jgi:asparagine synthase (glutamine-hydrolysing)/putative beta-lactam synthetase
MSALAGFVDFRSNLHDAVPLVTAMTQCQRNRGPDAQGIWTADQAALGHRRLARAGAPEDTQPAVTQAGETTVALVYDGAIYNLDELKSIEGTSTRVAGKTDAEILLGAYMVRGTDLFSRLNGVFAFAIWDGRKKTLILARDRIGIKPLYYFEHTDGLIFASEPKGIIAHPRFRARLDLAAMPIVLQPRLASAGETPLIGLHELPAAHVVTYSAAGKVSQRFWQLASVPHPDSFPETAARVRELLYDAVVCRLPSDGACSAMLSGGVDSTSVAAFAATTLQARSPARSLESFCMRFTADEKHFAPTALRPEKDAPYAASAAEAIGTRHQTVAISREEVLEAIPATRRARDLPGWGQFDASMYLLFQRMRQASTVGLSGETADELFGGYPYMLDSQLVARRTFPWLGDGPQLSHYLSPELTTLAEPIEHERERYAQAIAQVPALPGEDPMNARMREVLHLGMLGPMAVVLDREERMSMSHGFDVRLPFCDHRLIEYVWNVPWSMKRHEGLKGLLKAAVKDVVPQRTLMRQKSAYPHLQDPNYDQALISSARRIVNDSSSLRWMFDTSRINSLLDSLATDESRLSLPGGTSNAQLLIPLVELEGWLDEYHVAI